MTAESTDYLTYTADTLVPAKRPTFYFVGVSTGQSSIRRVFPEWARELDLGQVDFVGIDMPLHAPSADYRKVVEFFREDAHSLGALVTTHKLDLYHAAADLFDEADPLTVLMDEVSCISKRGGRLRAHAKDPITAGFAIDAILPPAAWKNRSAFVMGAGGSAIAIAWHLTQVDRAGDLPAEIVVSNRSEGRLTSLRDVYAQFDTEVPLRVETAATTSVNDSVLAGMPDGSFIVNATGLGKDAPGSPLSGSAQFPSESVAWDLNYRGDLVFLDQARAQEVSRGVKIEDGWIYFIHGWTSVIAEVFDLDIPTSGPGFDRLSEIARDVRGA